MDAALQVPSPPSRSCWPVGGCDPGSVNPGFCQRKDLLTLGKRSRYMEAFTDSMPKDPIYDVRTSTTKIAQICFIFAAAIVAKALKELCLNGQLLADRVRR